MNLQMTKDEREAFVAAVRVGILSIAEEGRGPLAVPVWYDYEPGGGLWFLTDRDSRKGRLLTQGARVSLCVQTESPPYEYVSIEGPVTSIRAGHIDADLRPMARRYLGPEGGDAYAESASSAGGDASIRVDVAPEHWLTVDYSKRG